ncbi:MAG TPA: SPOR domain-containing protein [Candidatus Omnitrophota bacterium]|nr:SPOR domain-containing protein [Candidatus Omnitrophota bacterium]
MFHKQSQFELFPGAPGASPEKEKSQFSFHALALTFENMVVASVVFVMLLIIAFAFGVEKGKQLQIAKAQVVEVEAQTAAVNSQPFENKQIVDSVALPAVGGSLDASPKTGLQAVQVQPEIVEKEAVDEKSVDKTASLDKIHTIQVASFKQQERADREAGTLNQKKFDAFVVKKGTHYIVCVGKYNERSQATGMLKNLRKTYKDCLIRSL